MLLRGEKRLRGVRAMCWGARNEHMFCRTSAREGDKPRGWRVIRGMKKARLTAQSIQSHNVSILLHVVVLVEQWWWCWCWWDDDTSLFLSALLWFWSFVVVVVGWMHTRKRRKCVLYVEGRDFRSSTWDYTFKHLLNEARHAEEKQDGCACTFNGLAD